MVGFVQRKQRISKYRIERRPNQARSNPHPLLVSQCFASLSFFLHRFAMATATSGALLYMPLPVRAPAGALSPASASSSSSSCSFIPSLTAAVPSGLRSGHSSARRFGQPRNAPIRALVQAVDLTKVVPQADRVLVRLGELPDKSAGGVLLPKSVAKFENYLVGEVISVGKEAAPIEKGQKVLFSDINAYEVNLGTAEKLCFCRIGDLLAIVE
ncbi:hypothetical protein CY35_01G082100 [Sphagnum magellanicum]|nr:hypothetical protein CY35_01G082100 [Sphagnum magellanicum]